MTTQRLGERVQDWMNEHCAGLTMSDAQEAKFRLMALIRALEDDAIQAKAPVKPLAESDLPGLPEGLYWTGLSGPNLDQPPWMARSDEDGGIECYATEYGIHADSDDCASVPFPVLRAVLIANGVEL